METNPHQLLPFAPKTTGGHEIEFMSYFIMQNGKTADLKVCMKNTVMYCKESGRQGLIPSEFDLVYTETPPFANQPYTIWQKEQDALAMQAKLERYEKALQEIAQDEHSVMDAICIAGGFHNAAFQTIQAAREALKGEDND